MWEIGELTTGQLQAVRDIVSKGAGGQWNDIRSDAKKARQKVLSKFLQKIEQPNRNMKKRKKYKKIRPLFSKGEVLAVPINNRYRCIIFEKFYQCEKDAYYSFVVTTYDSHVEPDTETILIEEVPVTKKTNAGEYGIRTLDIPYQLIEEHKSAFIKSGIIQIDAKAEALGFSRQISGLDDLQGMEQEMNDVLLGEKAELYVCCAF